MKNKTALLAIGIALIGVITFYTLNQKSNPKNNTPSSQTEVVSNLLSPSLSFSQTSLALTKDHEATISVTLDPDSHTTVAATIAIKFDPTKVAVTEINNGAIFPVVLSPSKIANGLAQISIGTNPSSKGQSVSATLLTLKLKSLSNTSSTISFSDDTMVAALDLQGNILKSTGTLKVN